MHYEGNVICMKFLCYIDAWAVAKEYVQNCDIRPASS
jgi:hypothetical protein